MLHLERIDNDLQAFAENAATQQNRSQQQLSIALTWFRNAPAAPALCKAIEESIGSDGLFHGAYPRDEGLIQQTHHAISTPVPNSVLIGVDGSQIFPDRHAPFLYYLLQVGSLTFRYDGSTPTPATEAWFRFRESELYNEQGLLVSAESLGVERTVLEMTYLASQASEERDRVTELCETTNCALFALTDGPLQWAYTEQQDPHNSARTKYVQALNAMETRNVIPVGYVDRPGGSYILDMLWTGYASREEHGIQGQNLLRHFTDRQLMEAVLPSGSRTPWYSRRNQTWQKMRNAGQELWFCYLNVGHAEHPRIVRLEVPAWAARQTESMDILQRDLLHQAQIVNDPYPYVLARAHEEALVSTREKVALEQLLQRKLLEQGVFVYASGKAQQKALLGHGS